MKGGRVRVGHDELRLDGGADDVPRARRHAAAALRGGPAEPLTGDVELVVSELVTNALLHAGTPASLRVMIHPGDADTVVRVEVRDPVRTAPMRAIASSEAMTGRGIALVEALASAWGVEHDGDGKIVWTELSTAAMPVQHDPGDLDIDALLAAWDDESVEPHRVTVRLGDVPTDLLLSAKAHVDNLVREFMLAASGAESGASAAVPAHLAELVETVVHRFAEPRRAIKRQAVAAASAGLPRTDLVLTLSPSAVEAGQAYLEALDEADAYARAARLLTLETPPQHRVFRRWYVESLIGQVTADEHHEPGPPLQPFESRLLDEVDKLSSMQRATERSARLQEVTAALGAATTAQEVADVVVIEGVAALGATGGSVLLPWEDPHVSLPGAYGYTEALLAHLRDELRDTARPSWLQEQVWVESRQERDALFPDLATLEPQTAALCIVPLAVGERVLGALRFSFDNPRLFEPDERRFVLSLAAQTAQALDRSILFAAERSARASAEGLADRLARLQRVTADLTGAADVDQIAEIVVSHTADALGARLATLSLVLDDGHLSMTRHQGLLASDADQWRSYPVSSTMPAGEAVLTQRAVVVAGPGELARRYPVLASRLSDPRDVLICVPLRFGQRVIGVLSLSFDAQPDGFDEGSVVTFLQTLCDATAQAIQQYRALESARDANDKLSFLAQASAVMSSSLDQHQTLSSIAQLVVPRLADLCNIHLVEDGRIHRVALAHITETARAPSQSSEARRPYDPDAPAGIARVIRSGRSELYATIDEELLSPDAPDERRLDAAPSPALSSMLLVPMVGRTGVIGAIALVYTESGRHYDEGDRAMAEDLARRAAVAVEHAEQFTAQSGRLAAITRVAEAAQHAILAPVPPRLGNYLLSAAYISAAREALIGGDLYEVVPRPNDGLRLLIGDVRGKGLDAVRVATIVLGEFRAAAADERDLEEVAGRVDRRLAAYLGEEDFVTALMVDLGEDGSCRIVCCGHPPAIIAKSGVLTSVPCRATVPLGLGARPQAVSARLAPGDRLLLFTDGLVEARRPDGRFVELAVSTAPLGTGGLDTVLDRVLAALHEQVGPELGDDLALVAAEYRP